MIKDITLQSMDGKLVARNEDGHLIYPMLHLDRDPVLEDTQGWEQVLVFVDGKTRSTISPTVIVLFEENGFLHPLEIQTGGDWSITGVDNSLIRVSQTSGTGNALINVTKAPSFNESGIHQTAFTITIAGASASETSIHVYLFMGGGGSDINQVSITLNEVNDYSQPLGIPMAGEWQAVGVNESLIRLTNQMDGILITKAPTLTAIGNYTSEFAIIAFDASSVTIVQVTIDVSLPLRVRYGNITARHGETITVNLNAPNYSAQYLSIIRDRAWSLTGVDASKITVSPTSGSGSTSEWDSETVSISKPPNLTVDTLITTTFRIVSFTQFVDVIVNIIPQITGEFVDPRAGEVGATGTEPVYIYI